jgi:CDP-glycerol glycerophosphotransferase (TagB/SpsB family)
VDPARNYFVSRKSLLKQGLAKVDDWRYFTLFAPRQSGKSTYFQFLVEYIRQENRSYLPIWLSFEAYSDFDMADFISRLSLDLILELERSEPERTVSSPFFKKLIDLSDWFRTLTAETGKEIVLIIDEMEGLNDLTT